MKLLIRISVALAMLLAGFFGISMLLPKQGIIKQSILIAASPEQVFPLLNSPADWKRWSAWSKTYDPTLIYMYGGPLSGEGARQNWSGDKTGNWQMVFTGSTAPDSLAYELKQVGQTIKTTGCFTLHKTENGTLVTWQQTTPIQDNAMALYKGAWQNYKTEQEILLGLNNLQKLISDTKQNTAKK